MASKAVRLGINASYKSRHVKRPQKGLGVYALQLPGFPSGIHAQRRPDEDPCRCGRCSTRPREVRA